ncbi:MAG: NADH-quinone oxidoreductase subunit H [Planctomycetes bacterium]|nr:NADH-quinone oxidoreductase subunit H [Planctomycetota bacterium]
MNLFIKYFSDLIGIEWLGILVGGFLAVTLSLLPILAIAGFSTYIERKVSALMQRRVGPYWKTTASLDAYTASVPSPVLKFVNKLLKIPGLRHVIDIRGIVQFLVDGLKLLIKEDIVPQGADRLLFKLAPYFVIIGACCAYAVIPFSPDFQVADLNIGVLYILAVTSATVIGILMAGWGSNNKWSLLGGFRSAAQIVSYEVPVGLSVLAAVIFAGSMQMSTIISNQEVAHSSAWFQGWCPSWLSFLSWNLFGFGKADGFGAGVVFLIVMPALFLIYYIATLAECNRTPFDIPEAESELVSGYHTEYSGMRFAFFFLGEYMDMIVVSAIAVTLFFGGYQLPVADAQFHAWGMETLGFLATNLIYAVVFLAKVYVLVLVQMWLRWTLPRFRVDQMMHLCWTKLIPLSFLSVVLIAWFLL